MEDKQFAKHFYIKNLPATIQKPLTLLFNGIIAHALFRRFSELSSAFRNYGDAWF